MAQNFMSVHEKKTPDVASHVDLGRKLQIAKNCKKNNPNNKNHYFMWASETSTQRTYKIKDLRL